jgi:hypothetical protein
MERPALFIFSMVLIRTNWNSFEEYLDSLSKSARKNYKAGKWQGYEEVPFNREEVDSFMKLWSQQLVRGKHPEWAFPVATVEGWWLKGNLKVFKGALGMQFIQKRDGYWECHPPMYDKKHVGYGTWMWFQLIKYAIEHKLAPLNLGGGIDEWRAMIKRREEFPNPWYKWRFVPQKAKENPDSEPNYFIESWKLLLKN